jgi:hypothetical protein
MLHAAHALNLGVYGGWGHHTASEYLRVYCGRSGAPFLHCKARADKKNKRPRAKTKNNTVWPLQRSRQYI